MYKKIILLSLLVLPGVLHAQGIFIMLNTFTNYLLSIIPLLVSLAVLVFFWGLVKFMAHAGDEKTHEEGKNIMVWGMLTLFVMVSFWGIVAWMQQSVQLNNGIGGNAPNTPITIPR